MVFDEEKVGKFWTLLNPAMHCTFAKCLAKVLRSVDNDLKCQQICSILRRTGSNRLCVLMRAFFPIYIVFCTYLESVDVAIDFSLRIKMKISHCKSVDECG